jgi:hypothetical protein
MTLRRSLLPAIAIAIAAMSNASAQFSAPAAPAGKPPCFDEFVTLRDEAQNRMKAAHDAGKRKPTPQEMCRLIGRYAESEAKLVKFLEDNSTWCGIPAPLTQQVKATQPKTVEARKRVCDAAAAPRPTGPTLGDALGTTRVPDVGKARTGTGTFDTLTGSTPAR